MRHLLAFALLSVVSSVSFSALAEKPEAPKEEAGKGEHAEAKSEHAEGKGEKGEHEEAGGEEGEEKEPKFSAALDTVVGWGNLPEAGSSAVTSSFLLGGKYSLTPEFALGARWPFTAGGITEETGSKTDIAVGNLEIAGEYGIPVARGIKVPIELGIALPTASGGEFENDENKIRRAALNEAAAATRGGENNALFAAHRLGIIPLVGLEYERSHIELAVWTKMEILIKAGGASPADPRVCPEDEPNCLPIEQKKVAAESVSGLGIHYWLLDDKLGIGTRAWFSAAIAEESEDPSETNKPSKFQFVVEPGLKVKASAFRGGLSYILPIAGALGDRKVGGVHLVLGMAY